jgi:hypothetical protein
LDKRNEDARQSWRLSEKPALWGRALRATASGLLYLLLIGVSAWASTALFYDFPIHSLRAALAIVYAVTIGLTLIVVKGKMRRAVLVLAAFLGILGWWLTLKPSNNRPWQLDVAQTTWAEIKGDDIILHNVRNCDYRTETDYTPHWETRRYSLSRVRGIDLFQTYWGSPWIAHTILSFEFADGQFLAYSIETRKEIGETYSTIAGFFRQYELTYIAADERDVVRLRSNYRHGENVYLFHTRATPERARAILFQYLERANGLHNHPEWYNALTDNCTTNIRVHTAATAGDHPEPWDIRILLNGKLDELLYERHALAGDLPLEELKRRAYINPVAKSADQDPKFSLRIREGRPGF